MRKIKKFLLEHSKIKIWTTIIFIIIFNLVKIKEILNYLNNYPDTYHNINNVLKSFYLSSPAIIIGVILPVSLIIVGFFDDHSNTNKIIRYGDNLKKYIKYIRLKYVYLSLFFAFATITMLILSSIITGEVIKQNEYLIIFVEHFISSLAFMYTYVIISVIMKNNGKAITGAILIRFIMSELIHNILLKVKINHTVGEFITIGNVVVSSLSILAIIVCIVNIIITYIGFTIILNKKEQFVI